MTVDFNWAEWKPKITGIEQEIEKKKKRFDWLQPFKDWGRYFSPEVSERLRGTLPDPEVDVPEWLPLPRSQIGRQPLSRVTENIAMIPLVGDVGFTPQVAKQIPRVAREVAEEIPQLIKRISPEGKTVFAQKEPIKIVSGLQNTLPYTNPDLPLPKVRQELSKVVGEISNYIGKTKKPFTGKITEETLKKNIWNRALDRVDAFVTRSYRVERLLERMDGFTPGSQGKLGGKMWQTFYEPINEATNRKLYGISEQLGILKRTLTERGIKVGTLLNQKISFGDMVVTPSERMGIYLHSKNPENLRHLMRGNKISQGQVDVIVNSMPDSEKIVADQLFDLYQKRTADIARVYKQVTGKEFKSVQDYVPIFIEWRAQPMISPERILSLQDKMKFMDDWASSGIKKGFTIKRAERANQPIKLDAIGDFMTYLQNTEHYLNFAPVVRDLQGIIKHPLIKDKMVQKFGAPEYQVVDQWLKDVAETNPLRAKNHAEALLRTMRVNATTAVLGFNITTAMKQFPSFVAGMSETGVMPALKGLMTYIKHPQETSRLIKKFSPQITERYMEREFAEARLGRTGVQKFKGQLSTREVFMAMSSGLDKIAVNSLWRGAFDNALRRGIEPKLAADFAESVIRKTQPFFSVKDVPEYWRSGEFMKALTMFTNQLNNYWNYFVFDIAGKASAKEIGKTQVLEKVIETFVVPTLMIGAISRSKLPQDIGEIGRDLASGALAEIPVFGGVLASGMREAQSSAGVVTTEILDKLQSFSYNLFQGEWAKAFGDVPEMAGYATGIPVSQPKRSIMALLELAEGKTDDLMSLIWGSYTREKTDKEETPQPSFKKASSGSQQPSFKPSAKNPSQPRFRP